MNLIEIMTCIKSTKDELDFTDDEVRKSYSPYVVNRMLSMTEFYIFVVNEMNKSRDVPISSQYIFYRDSLPNRNTYDKYIKGTKELNADEKIFISQYYEIGVREVDEYIKVLSEEQIKDILKKYIHGSNKKPTI